MLAPVNPRFPNVAIVAPAIAREGITKQVANQVTSLQEENVNVSLIVLSDFDVDVLKELGACLPKHNLLLLYQKDSYLSPQAFLRSLSVVGPILRFLKKNSISVIIANAPYAHFIMRLVKLFSFTRGLKLTLHQYYHGLQYAQYPLDSFSRVTVNRLNQVLAYLFDDSHISISEATKTDIEANLIRQEKHTVIYNPVKSLLKAPPKEVLALKGYESTWIVALPGRLDHNKGQLFFLDVLKEFVKRREVGERELLLLIIGAGEIEEEIKLSIKSKGLVPFVKLTGAVANIELQSLLRKSHLVVVPSFIEGLSFVALEALAEGKLLLASDAGGLKEVVKDGETGILFASGDKEDCLSKFEYIYHNRSKELIDSARVEEDISVRFSYDQYREQLRRHLFQKH